MPTGGRQAHRDAEWAAVDRPRRDLGREPCQGGKPGLECSFRAVTGTGTGEEGTTLDLRSRIRK